jgi:hypothetical protein
MKIESLVIPVLLYQNSVLTLLLLVFSSTLIPLRTQRLHVLNFQFPTINTQTVTQVGVLAAGVSSRNGGPYQKLR